MRRDGVSVLGADQLRRDLLYRVIGRAEIPVGARPLCVLVDPDDCLWDKALATDAVIVVVTTRSLDERHVAELLVRGADAVVPEDVTHEELGTVVADVVAGHTVADGRVVRRLAELARAAVAGTGQTTLSARESEVLRHIAEGLSVKQTARALSLSEKTVENTRGRLFKKLGVRGCAHAVARAYHLGLLAERSELS